MRENPRRNIQKERERTKNEMLAGLVIAAIVVVFVYTIFPLQPPQ